MKIQFSLTHSAIFFILQLPQAAASRCLNFVYLTHVEFVFLPVLMLKIKTKVKMTRWSRNILKGKAKEIARGPMKDKYFSNATSKLYLKKVSSFWRQKQVEVLLAREGDRK